MIFSVFILFSNPQFNVLYKARGVKYLAVCVACLTLGSVGLNAISSNITRFGIGEGTSMLICISILSDISNSIVANNILSWSRQSVGTGLRILGAMSASAFVAAFLLSVRRTIPLSYFDFDTDHSSLKGLAEVQPMIIFPAVPYGMMPIFSASITISLFSLIAHLSPPLRNFLSTRGTSGLVAKFALSSIFILLYNVADMNEVTKELAEGMVVTGVRIPGVRPGKQTSLLLQRSRDSACFLGGVALAILTVLSFVVDMVSARWFGKVDISITSMLIIVGSITSLRQSVEAYSQAPKLLKAAEKFQSV